MFSIRVVTACALSFSFALSACGGGGAPSLRLMSHSPDESSQAVARDATFTASFDGELEAASAQSVQLLGPLGLALPADVAVSGNGLRVSASAGALPGATRYTVRLPAQLQSKDGRALTAPQSISFTTAAQQWASSASTISSGSVPLSDAQLQLASDGDGNLVATWIPDSVLPNTAVQDGWRYDRAAGRWDQLASVSVGSSFPVVFRDHRLSSSGEGHVYLAWTVISDYAFGKTSWVYLRQLGRGAKAWGTLETIRVTPVGIDMWPRVMGLVVDDVGNITILSTLLGGSSAVIAGEGQPLYATRFDAKAQRWSEPFKLDATLAGAEALPMVADRQGRVTVAWLASTAAGTVTTSSTLDPASGTWSAPQRLGTATSQPLLAAAPSGAVAMLSLRGCRLEARYLRADSSAVWTPLELLHDAGAGDCSTTSERRLVLDAAGNATAVWRIGGVYTAQRDAVTGKWAAASELLSASALSLGELQADIAGNLYLAHVQASRLHVMRFSASEKRWYESVAVDAPIAGTVLKSSSQPRTVLSASGAVAVAWISWVQREGLDRYEVKLNEFR